MRFCGLFLNPLRQDECLESLDCLVIIHLKAYRQREQGCPAHGVPKVIKVAIDPMKQRGNFSQALMIDRFVKANARLLYDWFKL